MGEKNCIIAFEKKKKCLMPLKLKWKFRNEAMINSHECGDNFIFPTRWQPHGCSGCERTYFLNLFEKMLQKIVERILKIRYRLFDINLFAMFEIVFSFKSNLTHVSNT